MDRSELASLDGDADVPSGSDESVEVAPGAPPSRWDLGPELNSESAGIRELPNPDRPIM